MEKLLRLFNNWEIQLLVLFSFMLQFFLFFAGGLRRRTTSKLLKFVIWMAYLGADLVAVYTLGFLSRHEDAIQKDTLMGAHQLAFFWAPFLLIHLGGQDTITAFAIEDNNLWLRHLLNLVVQVTLALYIFWKSTSGPSMQLLVPSILLFVTGTIKYGERTWALWCGSLNNLASSTVPDYVSHLDGRIDIIVSKALGSIQVVRDVFADSLAYYRRVDHKRGGQRVDVDKVPKLLEIELGLMYDDIYTKAMVLRTRGGIILRCISQISFLVAFALFFASNKQRYNSVDNAITYALFIGGFSLEVCAIFITMRSPWIWAWLKARKCHGLSSFVLSTCIGLQRKRPLWSNYMGQYNLLNFLGQNDQQSDLWKRRVMGVIRKVVNKVCGRKQKLWISKLLDTKFVVADEIMRRLVLMVLQYRSDRASMDRQWPVIGLLLEKLLVYTEFDADQVQYRRDFAEVIFFFHVYTEVLLSRYSPTDLEVESVGVCRKISDYMLYLLATHPEMLPVKKDSENRLADVLDEFTTIESLSNNGGMDDAGLVKKLGEWNIPEPPGVVDEAQVSEIQEAWMMLLLYAAGKSRPEAHAAQLGRGGELLTFAWLLLAHHLLGDVGHRIELADIFHVEEAAIPGVNSPLHTPKILW